MEALEVCFAYRRLVFSGSLGSDQNSLAVSAMPLTGMNNIMEALEVCFAYRRLVYPGRLGSDQKALPFRPPAGIPRQPMQWIADL